MRGRYFSKNLGTFGTSLEAQWVRICLPMPGVQSLEWEDSTCLRATKPVCHNY